MPTNNGTVAALIACLAPIVAAAVVLFKINLTPDQQGELVLGLAAVLTAGATIYASVVHHGTAKVAVAKANAAQPSFTTGSSSTFTVSAPAPRVRKSRAKPKTPPAA